MSWNFVLKEMSYSRHTVFWEFYNLHVSSSSLWHSVPKPFCALQTNSGILKYFFDWVSIVKIWKLEWYDDPLCWLVSTQVLAFWINCSCLISCFMENCKESVLRVLLKSNAWPGFYKSCWDMGPKHHLDCQWATVSVSKLSWYVGSALSLWHCRTKLSYNSA